MLPEKIVIFGFPRSGTKLLANILEQQNYFNFGEFFETMATDIADGDIPVAVRMSPHDQYILFEKMNSQGHKESHIHSELMSKRIDLFNQYKDKSLSTVTLHIGKIEMYPELLLILDDRFFLCTRRANKFEQLLSRIITYYHKNYDGEIESKRIIINLMQFERFYFQLKKLERIQDFIVSSGKGKLIDFDKLINGTEDLGFKYKITTADQHADLESLVINLDEIKSLFEQLTREY